VLTDVAAALGGGGAITVVLEEEEVEAAGEGADWGGSARAARERLARALVARRIALGAAADPAAAGRWRDVWQACIASLFGQGLGDDCAREREQIGFS
jgi:hypothetical protein